MRALLAVIFWWVVLAGAWLLYVGQHTKENAVAGAIAATIAVGFAVLVARLGLYRFGFHARRPLARAALLPWHVLRDFGLVALALLRGRPAGGFVELELRAGSAGDRAVAGLLASVAPNAYVVDIDPKQGRALVHELETGRARGTLL
jgi:multisubunit Na+/H+ antiporter MnhE subunit